jgi:hypothetical protein
MSQPDLKKRRKGVKNDDDSLDKSKPKKSRGKTIVNKEINEDNPVSEGVSKISSENNEPLDDVGSEDAGSKGKLIIFRIISISC